MPTKYVLEELDDATRDYLLAVRDREGKGTPGVFIAGSNPWPLLGLICGPIVAAVTVAYTLGSDEVLNDPDGLALLQTAGLVLGGWMFLAAFRSWGRSRSRKVAGHWTYGDPLFLYEAKAEQVAVTPMGNVADVTATHNLNNGAYSNTFVVMKFADDRHYRLTLADQRRTEALVAYYNYLAWARGPEGGERANLPPAVLGGVAKYVAKNDEEPIDPATGSINLNLIELETQEMPEGPQRVGHGGPHFLMYLFILAAGFACFLVMREVNVPARDDAVFNVVRSNNKPPNLRAYLVDSRNTRHRDEVVRMLGEHYRGPIIAVKMTATDRKLGAAMAGLLEGLKSAEAPALSVRVTETKSPPGKQDGAKARADKVRDRFAEKAGFTIGSELIAFVEAPDETNPHIDIAYELTPDARATDRYSFKATVSIRDKIEEAPKATSTVFYSQQLPGRDVESLTEPFTDQLVRAIVGKSGGGNFGALKIEFNVPDFNVKD